MKLPCIVSQSQIAYCSITVVGRVRKIVHLDIFGNCPLRKKDLKHRGVLIFATRGRDSTHLFQRVSKGSGMGSSHWTAILQSSCKMTFTGRR